MSDAYQANAKTGGMDLVHIGARKSGHEVNANVAVASRSAAALAPKAKGGAPPKQNAGESTEAWMARVRQWRTDKDADPETAGQKRALSRMQ